MRVRLSARTVASTCCTTSRGSCESGGVIADPRRLRPTEAVRLINSTPAGTVVDEWAIRQDLGALGFRIAPDGRRLNLLNYTAWLAHGRHSIEASRRAVVMQGDGGDDYERKREREAARARESARSTRDIGEIPPVKNERRRRRARRSLRYFLETYFPGLFSFKWSSDHMELIRITEDLLRNGGQHAKAMWRGGGKTTVFECSLLWASLEGLRRYALLLSNTSAQAEQSFGNITTLLETNDLLGEDYPEVCYPIRCLEGIAQRAKAQLYRGERTRLHLAAKVMIYPMIPGAPGASAIIRCSSLDSAFRGVGFIRPDDNTKARPDAVLIDDPQTAESARSPVQCDQRERLIQGDVLGTSGVGKSMAAVMACTVICEGDLSSRYLNTQLHPAWRGKSAKLVIEWPTATEHWEEYALLWTAAVRDGDTRHKRATAYYRKHRKEMDAGAVVAWPDAYLRGVELSALQSAWNTRLRLKDPAFFAECQNDPLPDRPQSSAGIEEAVVMQRLNGLEHGVVPLTASRLTGFIDVQGRMLFWAVVAWDDDFTGAVIDYGTLPSQPVRHFTLANASVTFEHRYPGLGLEARLRRGLDDLADQLVTQEFKREDSTGARISRLMVDANWGVSTDLVYEFCRRSPHSGVLTPAHGRWVGATSRSFSEYERKAGDRVGLNWRIPADHGRRFVRRCLFDSNFWKTFVSARLAIPVGDRGSLSLWGRDPERHRLFAEQLAAESREEVEAKGRSVTQWSPRRPGIDNHWLDCIVGASVAASIEGCAVAGVSGASGGQRQRVSFSELQRQQRARR